MAEHVWTVFCRRAIIDRESDSVSLVDTLDGINVEVSADRRDQFQGDEISLVEFKFYLVSSWLRSSRETPEKAKYRARLIDGSGRDLFPFETNQIGLSELAHDQTFFQSEVIPLRGQGQYAFEVEIQRGRAWELVARVPFDVTIEIEPTRKAATKVRGKSAPKPASTSKGRGRRARSRP